MSNTDTRLEERFMEFIKDSPVIRDNVIGEWYIPQKHALLFASQELSKKDEEWKKRILEIIGNDDDTECKDLNRKDRKIYDEYLTKISRSGRNELRSQQRKQLDALSKEGGDNL